MIRLHKILMFCGLIACAAGCSQGNRIVEEAPGSKPNTICINAGATMETVDADGVKWLPERGFYDGGAVANTGAAFRNPSLPMVCRSEHYGMSGFWVALPNGRYLVKLTFCESYAQITGPGQRVFKVDVEGMPLGSIDPYKDAGGIYQPFVKQADVNVLDGKLDITFESLVQHPQINAIHIVPVIAPGETTAPVGFDQPREVPHGQVVSVVYESKTVGYARPANIYIPPNYDPSRTYPVLYLLHGGGNNVNSWRDDGHIAPIMDNLLAEGKVQPMLIVMPSGFLEAPGQKPAQDRRIQNQRKWLTQFEDDIIHDLIPYVESHYSVASDADHRALAGLSMGAGQSLWIGPRHSDRFAYLGLFSGGLLGDSAKILAEGFPDAASINPRMKLFWVSTGNSDHYYASIRQSALFLTSRGVHFEWHLQQGPHEWPVWNEAIYLFSQRLFK